MVMPSVTHLSPSTTQQNKCVFTDHMLSVACGGGGGGGGGGERAVQSTIVNVRSITLGVLSVWYCSSVMLKSSSPLLKITINIYFCTYMYMSVCSSI